VHVHGIKHEAKFVHSGIPAGNINSKAALLSGDPGIGKTTAARLIASELNYDCI
jgi:Holliday junction resolvasome RuvABC ATP-dependent DNA helicase subunit